ncbi:MAG: restriction endonuclease [Planctomycetota bacterium]|nr:restriction endonuclease [Planctomycetota bacterium]
MDLRLPIAEGDNYKSPSQRARVVTESWAAENAFCVACPSERLTRARTNTAVLDFTCPRCDAPYQLKASTRPVAKKIMDAGYEAMMRAIRRDALPHFLVMRYETESVRDLLVIPRFVLSPSAIEKRPPLAPTARRAGWVGCNILVTLVPPEGRIVLVDSGLPVSPDAVREQFKAVENLSTVATSSRGWTLDVLTGLRSLGKGAFSLQEAYGLERELARLYPRNRNIRPKIRQQLQVLRDLGYLRFRAPGQYEFREFP